MATVPASASMPHAADLSSNKAAYSLQDLPLECLLHILRQTHSGADHEALEQTCKALRTALHSPVHWKQRLAEEFGVSMPEPLLDALPAAAGSSRGSSSPTLKEIKALYKQLASPSSEQNIRFRGCYTDGGCDGGQLRYWVMRLADSTPPTPPPPPSAPFFMLWWSCLVPDRDALPSNCHPLIPHSFLAAAEVGFLHPHTRDQQYSCLVLPGSQSIFRPITPPLHKFCEEGMSSWCSYPALSPGPSPCVLPLLPSHRHAHLATRPVISGSR